ncbi:MAG: hypothetical protein WDZ77_03015 [Candidatus Pacearchaeota archaeon]
MEMIMWSLIGITALFFVLLAIKSFLKSEKFCVICSSVTLTWIMLLILHFMGVFTNKIIIAILMGMTALGIYYAWEKKTKNKNLIFRLPLLLTLIFIIYSILSKLVLEGLYFIIILWGFFILIYFFEFNKFARKLVECCKKW